MITSLRIKNYKSLKDSGHVSLSNVNLFTGINGMGKSSLIQILLIIKQSFRADNLRAGIRVLSLNGVLTNLGTTTDIITERRDNNLLSIEIASLSTEKVEFIYEYDKENLNKTHFHFQRNRELPLNRTLESSIYKAFPTDFEYLNAERISPKLFYSESYQRHNLSKLGNHGEHTIRFLDGHKNRDIYLKGLAHKNSIRFEEKDRNSENPLPDYNLISQVNAWMQEISPDVQIKPKRHPAQGGSSIDFSFETGRGATNDYHAPNVGFGIIYALPIVVALLSAKENSMLIIENPEAHIHPKGQTKLAELMAKAGQAGVQLFIETHSDHIFYGLRVAVKEGDIDAEKVKVHFFSRNAGEHTTKIEQINIDSKGGVDNYPNDFFDEYEMNLNKLI